MRSLTFHHQAPALELHRREVDGVAVFEARGTLDLFTAPAMRTGLHDAVQEGCEAVVVDLCGVAFIDSTGVAALVRCQRELRSRGRLAVVRAPGGVVARLFERIRAEQIFPIYDRLADAFLAIR